MGRGAERVNLLKCLTKIRDSLILNVVSHIKHQTRFLLSLNERTISHKESICMIMRKQKVVNGDVIWGVPLPKYHQLGSIKMHI